MRLKIGLLKGLDAGLYEAWQIVPLCRRFHHRAACAAFFANFHNFFFQLFPSRTSTSQILFMSFNRYAFDLIDILY